MEQVGKKIPKQFYNLTAPKASPMRFESKRMRERLPMWKIIKDQGVAPRPCDKADLDHAAT